MEHSIVVPQKKKKNGGCQQLGRAGDGELLFNSYRVSVLQDEKSSGDGGDDYTIL